MRMKILFMADSFLPHAGGSRVYYYNLYSHLVKLYPDCVTILTKKVPGWKEFDASASCESLRIIRRFQPLPNLQARNLPKIVFPLTDALLRSLRGRTDLIHAGDLYPPGVICLALKQLLGIPFLAYCHGEDITLTERYRYQPAVRNLIYHRADAVVAACEFARQNLLRIGVQEDRIVKITPGVDCERFSPRPASEQLVRRYNLENRPVLMTVARLFPRKGHEMVLRTLARILPRIPDAVYVIVGKGPERARLEQLAAELNISQAVRFVGYVPEEDLADFYNLCDVFIMMNHEEENGDIEGFGMVFLEASATGKAVIGGRSGGTADSVVHGVTGFLVEPDDADGLAAKLSSVLENGDLRKRLGGAGLRRANAEFSWKTRAESLRELSRSIVERERMKSRSESYSIAPSSD
jgi:phosphatidyl-myo-inositol dimannoside synthase